MEDIFIRSVALGHSPKLLAELINAATSSTTKMKKSPSASSLYSSPKILEIYLSILNYVSQVLNSSPESSSSSKDEEGIEWPPKDAVEGVIFLKIIMTSLSVSYFIVLLSNPFLLTFFIERSGTLHIRL